MLLVLLNDFWHSHDDKHASTSLIWQNMFPGLCYLFRHLQLIKLMLLALRHVSHVVGVSSTAVRRACSQVSSNNRSHHFSKANLRPWVACGILSPSPSARTALIYIVGKQRDLHRQDHRNLTIAKGAEYRKKRGDLKETEGFQVNVIKGIWGVRVSNPTSEEECESK